MFQYPRLLPWKRVIDNVGLGLQENWRAKAARVLEHLSQPTETDVTLQLLQVGGQ